MKAWRDDSVVQNTADPEDLGMITSTLVAAHTVCNSRPEGSDVLCWPLRALDTYDDTDDALTYVQADTIHIK